jgi:hypothetical protein
MADSSKGKAKAKAGKAAKASGKAKASAAKGKASGTAKGKAAGQRKAGGKATAASRAGARGSSSPTARRGSPVAISRDALRSLEEGQRSALEAVRRFAETVEDALPLRGDAAKRRQDIVDSALEMAERLLHSQYDLLRRIVDSAGRPFGDSSKRG